MRYFKKDGSVHAFDIDQEYLITDEYIELTAEELDKHLYPAKYLNDEEKVALHTTLLSHLTRRQFKRALHKNNLTDQIELAIAEIEDEDARSLIHIDYYDGTEFHRCDKSVLAMCDLLQLDEKQVNELWEYALTL